jgi:hypothetical protein
VEELRGWIVEIVVKCDKSSQNVKSFQCRLNPEFRSIQLIVDTFIQTGYHNSKWLEI